MPCHFLRTKTKMLETSLPSPAIFFFAKLECFSTSEHDALRAKKQNQNPGAAPLDPPWGAVKSKSKSKSKSKEKPCGLLPPNLRRGG